MLNDRISSRPMGWSEWGCHQMLQLRAYHWNNGKVIELLKYQKKKKRQDTHRQEQEELIKELRRKQSGWNYAEQMQGVIPGLEQHSLRWLKDMVHQALNA